MRGRRDHAGPADPPPPARPRAAAAAAAVSWCFGLQRTFSFRSEKKGKMCETPLFLRLVYDHQDSKRSDAVLAPCILIGSGCLRAFCIASRGISIHDFPSKRPGGSMTDLPCPQHT